MEIEKSIGKGYFRITIVTKNKLPSPHMRAFGVKREIIFTDRNCDIHAATSALSYMPINSRVLSHIGIGK
jgi:hypothetical protein